MEYIVFGPERAFYKDDKQLESTDDEPDKADDKADEQPDTTYIPKLESEESAEQRRNQQGQGLKILTPQQMLTNFFSSIKSRK